MGEHITNIEFTDQELKTLYDVLLSTKITASAQELLLLKMGKNQSAVLDVTFKVAQSWETRAVQLQKEQADAASTDETPSAGPR